jgi:hypothetical protein
MAIQQVEPHDQPEPATSLLRHATKLPPTPRLRFTSTGSARTSIYPSVLTQKPSVRATVLLESRLRPRRERRPPAAPGPARPPGARPSLRRHGCVDCSHRDIGPAPTIGENLPYRIKPLLHRFDINVEPKTSLHLVVSEDFLAQPGR